MAMFGSMYYIIPRLTQQEWPSNGLVKLHFWASASGISLCVMSLITGGVQQGIALDDPGVPILDVLKIALPYQTGCTLGVVLLALANAGFLYNILWALARYGRAICPGAKEIANNLKPTTIRVTR